MEPRRNASDNAFSTTGRYPFGGLRHSPRGAPVWPRTFPTACLAVLRERLLAGKSVPARSLDLYLRGGCLRMPARGVLSSTQTGGLRSVQGSEGGVMVSKLSAPSPLLQWGVLDVHLAVGGGASEADDDPPPGQVDVGGVAVLTGEDGGVDTR